MRLNRTGATLALCFFATVAGAQYLVQQPNGIWSLNNSPGISTTQVVVGNNNGTTAAVTATLVGATGKTTYLCGFSISAVGGTSPVGPITISGTTTPFTYQFSSAISAATLGQNFTPCIPSLTTGTSISIVTTGAAAASAVNVNSWGFLQ